MYNSTWQLHQVSLLDGGVLPWPLPIHTKHGDLSWSGDDEDVVDDVSDGGDDDSGDWFGSNTKLRHWKGTQKELFYILLMSLWW